MGFGREIESLVQAVVAGRTRWMDVGQVGNRLWLLNFGVGFDAAIVHRLAQWRKQHDGLKRVSRLSYVPRALRVLRDYTYPSITLEADGRKLPGGVAVFVLNFGLYGPKVLLSSECRGDDGLLDYVVFERPGRFAYVRDAIAMLRGKHLNLPHVQSGRAKKLRITSDAPMQIDGDPYDKTSPVEISVRPAAMRVIDCRG